MYTTEAVQAVKQAEQMPGAKEENTFWCILVHSGACWRILEHCRASWCILVHSGASWCILIHPGAFWCILVHPGGFWCILVHLGASWCILVHSGAFWYGSLSSGADASPESSKWLPPALCSGSEASVVDASPERKSKSLLPTADSCHSFNIGERTILMVEGSPRPRDPQSKLRFDRN